MYRANLCKYRPFLGVPSYRANHATSEWMQDDGKIVTWDDAVQQTRKLKSNLPAFDKLMESTALLQTASPRLKKFKQFEALQSIMQPLIQRAQTLNAPLNQFEKIDANVHYLEEAQVICLGERHNSKASSSAIGSILKNFSTQEDLILIEAPSSSSFSLDPERLYSYRKEYCIPPSLSIKGWDDLKSVELVLSQEDPDKTHELILKTLPERNRSLCKSIELAQESGLYRKIFVITGYQHLYCPPNHPNFNLFSQAIQETLQFLQSKTRSYAVLIPSSR